MKKLILFILTIFLLSQSVWATTTYLGSIDAAIDTALKSSGEIRAGQARFGISEAKVFTANSRLNPVFVTDSGIAEKTYRIGLQMIFETAGKRKKRTLAAQSEYEIAQEELNIKVLDIKEKVRIAYIDLYAAQEKEKSIQEMIQMADNLLAVANKKDTWITPAEVIQVEIIKLNAQIELEEAHKELLRAHSVLNLLLGRSLERSCVLAAPTLEERFKNISIISEEKHNFNLRELIEIASENRPELKLQEANMELADRELAIAKANRIPNLLIIAGPDLVSNYPGTLTVGAFIMTAVELPVFDRQQGAIKEAKAKQEVSRTEYEKQEDEVLNQIYESYDRILCSTKLINQYEKGIIPRANDLVERSVKHSKENKKDPITQLSARQTAMNAELTYIHLMSEYQNALSDLERALGAPLPKD